MSDKNITTLTLHFPLGISMREAQDISMKAEVITLMGVSQGGYLCKNPANLFFEDGPVEWDDTHAEFIHSYQRKPE
jgi:hypothetical protein